jgi:hypothetical protein
MLWGGVVLHHLELQEPVVADCRLSQRQTQGGNLYTKAGQVWLREADAWGWEAVVFDVGRSVNVMGISTGQPRVLGIESFVGLSGRERH